MQPRFRSLICLTIVLLLGILASCGQKGELYLPERETPAEAKKKQSE